MAKSRNAARWADFELLCVQDLSQRIEVLCGIESGEQLMRQTKARQEEYLAKGLPAFTEQLQPCVARIRSFITIAHEQLKDGDQSKLNVVWGIIDQLIAEIVELPERQGVILPEVLRALDDMSHDLQLFQVYSALLQAAVDSPDLATEVFLGFLRFWVGIIHFFRGHRHVTRLEPNWRANLDETSSQTRRRVQQAEELARALRLNQVRQATADQAELESQFQQLVGVGSRVEETAAAVDARIESEPCNTVHLPLNPRFTGRESSLKLIRDVLDGDPHQPRFASLALWGMGGVGKTQTALAYAHERIAKGTPAVFWLNAEKGLELSKSFTQMALALKLEGAVREGTTSQNRALVNNWLQKTRLPWLMVFDNVEDPGELQSCWPITNSQSRGSVLITSRHDVFAADPAADGFELPCFTESEGQAFLLKAIGRHTYSDAERASASAMNTLVGGLPLALNLMGGQIRSTRSEVKAFVTRYEQDVRRNLHKTPRGGVQNSYYPEALDTAFLRSFDPLDQDSVSILGVIAMCHPDDFPTDLFTGLDASALPKGLDFCADSYSFEDALTPLFQSSILTKDPGSSLIRIHRVLQDEFRRWLGPQRIQEHFLAAAHVLSESFPKQVMGRTLRDRASKCQRYIQHATTLCDRQRHYDFGRDNPSCLESFVELIKNCAWHLVETGEFDLCLKIIETAKDACKDHFPLVYAHLCNSAGVMLNERANPKEALRQYSICCEIREKQLPPNHPEMSNIYGNLATVLPMEPGTERALREAKSLLWKAIDIDVGNVASEGKGLLYLRYQNIGMVHAFLGEYNDALKYLEMGRACTRELFGQDEHWEAKADFKIGFVYFARNEFHQAKNYYQQAYERFNRLNPTLPTTTAAQYRLARIQMIEGNYSDAIHELRIALKACEVNAHRKGDQGDVARMKRTLATALEFNGEGEEAGRLKAEAEGLREQIQGDRFRELPDNNESYNKMVYWTYW